MVEPVIITIVAAVALGIAGQVVAERFQLPAILPLLVLGMLCGPAGLGLVHPESLGGTLEALIHLGVAIILFEGGLSLDPNRLAKVGAPVRNLLTIGVAMTGIGAAVAARLLVGMPWGAAALFGAVVTVTGPTVIVPLLRHLIAPIEVKTILLSEGLIVDPIGAVLAYVVLQWIARAGIPFRELMGQLSELAAVGIIVGFAAGALGKLILRSRLVSGEFRNLSILAILMVCYLVAEAQAHQSGILASVVMGFTISASELPDLVSVRAFKGQLTILIISMLFILLAAQLDLVAMVDLSWSGLLVVAALILVVRPASVFASIWPNQLDLKGRTVIALTAPRGIVAAAVASLAAREMGKAGLAGGPEMEGLVYLTILVTVAWSTVGALVLPRVLGYTSDPKRRRTILVGANAVTEAIAREVASEDRMTVVIDGVSWRLDRFRSGGLMTVVGDARDAVTFEEAGLERDSVLVATTTNDELNLLVAELVHSDFGVEHPVVAVQRPPEELGRRSRAWVDLLGAGSVDIQKWSRRLENGTAHRIVIDPRVEEHLVLLHSVEREHRSSVFRMVGATDGEVDFRVADANLPGFDELVLLVADGRPRELLQPAHFAEGESTEDESEPSAPDRVAPKPAPPEPPSTGQDGLP